MEPEMIELIEKGLMGTASEEEKKLIDSRMSDPEFRKAYEETKKLVTSMRLHQRKNLLKLMREEEIRLSATEKRSTTSVLPLRYWAAAAAVLLIGLFFVYNLIQERTDMFARNYEDLPALNALDSRGIGTGSLEASFQLYRDGRVDEALKMVNEYLAEHPDDLEAVFLRGLILLKDRQFEKAVDDLTRIETPDGRWYLALGYIGLKDYGQAKNILQILTLESGSDLKLKADKLLEELQEMETSAK